jgi:hypothetical protein
VKFTSPEDALRQGISAFNGGFYEQAIPALEHAAESNLFFGQYYLARVYADNNTPHTDHAKAYVLYQAIANEHADIDPEDDKRASFVAKSLTAVGRYIRAGLPEIGVQADAHRAMEVLHTAATIFGDEDAQFEIAKMRLKGEGGAADVRLGVHWLVVLTRKGHPQAQAFFADLLWRGQNVERDPVRAFALIGVALENAPPSDRVWIEDIYQNIYCGASAGVRKQADGLVADWRDRYRRKPEPSSDRSGLGMLTPTVERTCENGEPVVPFETNANDSGSKQPAKAPNPLADGGQPFFKGSSAAVGLREVGAPALSPSEDR